MGNVPTVKSAEPPSPYKTSKKVSVANTIWILGQCRLGVKQVALCNEFGLNSHTVSGWVKKYRDGKALQRSGGRPTSASPEVQEIWKEMVQLTDANPYCMPTQKMYEEVHRLRQEDAVSRGKLAESVVPMSVRTIKATKKKLGIQTKTAEYATDARIEGTASLRSLVSHMVLSMFVVALTIHAGLIINGDGSSMTVGYSGDNACEVKFRPRKDRPDGVKDFWQAKPGKGEISQGKFTIKIFPITNGCFGQKHLHLCRRYHEC